MRQSSRTEGFGCLPNWKEVAEELDEALVNDDIHSFSDVIADSKFNIDREFVEFDNSTLLHHVIAKSKDEGKTSKFVKEILRSGQIDINRPHTSTKMRPIHLAAEQGNRDIIMQLKRKGANINSKTENGGSALSILAARSSANWLMNNPSEWDNKMASFLRAGQYLLEQKEIQVDTANAIGATPLYFAVTKGTEAFAKILLQAGADTSVEIDDETIQELLEDKWPHLAKEFKSNGNAGGKDAAYEVNVENKLFHILYMETAGTGNAGSFMSHWQKAESINNNRINVNADDGRYSFLQYSCDQGLDMIVDFLLRKGADPNHACDNYKLAPILIASYHGYHRVIETFLRHAESQHAALAVDFNLRESVTGENILHKILKQQSFAHKNYEERSYDKCLKLILQESHEDSIHLQRLIHTPDVWGNTPLHYAAETSNELAVRKLLQLGADIGRKNLRGEVPIHKISAEIMQDFLDDCLESDGLPVDEDFELIFKYVFMGSNHSKLASSSLPESESLWHISKSKQHQALLLHPVISSFLCLKWRKIRPYYYMNLIFYLLFVVSLTAFLLTFKLSDEKHGGLKSGLKITTVVLLFALLTREFFQAVVSFRRYILTIENLLELSTIGMGLYLTLFAKKFDPNVAGIVIIFSWSEMVLLFGRHPKLSTYIAMFYTVSRNFCLFLLWYIFFIIAFGLSFSIVLNQGPGENESFSGLDLSLLKTIVMSLTGELEYTDIEFKSNVGIVLFLLYIFFIILVLVNLLNGLAISDITEIRKHAEIVAHVSRVELISYLESLLLGDPFQLQPSAIPCLQKVPALNCFRSLLMWEPLRKLLVTVVGHTLLFPRRLKRKRAVFRPNASQHELSLPGGLAHTDNLVLDKKILSSATALVSKRKFASKVQSDIEGIKSTLMMLTQQQSMILEKLNSTF